MATSPAVTQHLLLSAAVSSFISVPLYAAESTLPDESAVLQEVIVTAQKRAQNIQDVPIAISAISEAQLADRHIDDISDIALVTPGVSFVPSGPGQGQFVIRGIQVSANRATEPRFQPAVGVYFDELPVANALYNPSLNTFDMERVEVLRGPQGTLYGSGSLAGTVKFITNAPDAGGFDAAGRASLGHTENSPDQNYSADVMLNAPIVQDVAALRFVGGYRQDGGYVDNIADGSDGIGRTTTGGGRLAFNVKPSDTLSITLRAIAQRMQANGDGAVDLVSPGVSGRLGERQQWRLTPTPVRDDFNALSAEVEYDFGAAALTSVTSYLDRDIRNQFSHTNVLPTFLGAPLQFSPYMNPLRYHGVLQELRIASTSDGPFQWIGGAFYSDSVRRFAQNFWTPGIDTYLASIGSPATQFFGVSAADTLWESYLHFKERQSALFGELSYAFLDEKLIATAGGRWFKYDQDYATQAAGIYNGGVTFGSAEANTEDFNPKLVLSYKLADNVMIAAQASEGFRLGGANEIVPADVCGSSAPLSFGPEHLRNYELSAKTSWLDDRLIANLSVYEMHYRDIQLTQRFQPECGFSFTGNGGKATSRGVELELIGRAGALQWSVFGSWIDATLDKDTPPGINGSKGDRLPFSPRFSGNAYARYTRPMGASVDGFVQLEYRYVGERVQRVDYRLNTIAFDQPAPSYDIGNLQLGMSKDSWEAALYVDNLWDDGSILAGGGYAFGLPGAGRTVYVNRPRTIGLEFTVRTGRR
ncbi:TonB-dependent receptor [Steroidobacter flavus]|uniref:TonB-dependent receptor n=1 Tax=Steroidobacter flavus TaxID=1842136 RepID=A0ABV8SXL2_9GAMM